MAAAALEGPTIQRSTPLGLKLTLGSFPRPQVKTCGYSRLALSGPFDQVLSWRLWGVAPRYCLMPLQGIVLGRPRTSYPRGPSLFRVLTPGVQPKIRVTISPTGEGCSLTSKPPQFPRYVRHFFAQANVN
jgi:hypothetical protein